MNSQTYLEQEQSQQFSQEKMDEVVESKVGKSSMSPGMARELEYATKKAKLSGQSVRTCQVCNKPLVIRDTQHKETGFYCHLCEHMKPVQERKMKGGPWKTVGVGGRFSPQNPHRFEKGHPDFGK